MSERLEALPRIRFTEPMKYPTPDGHITSGELIEYLLPIWWGGLFCDLGSEISGHPVDHRTRLGKAATYGQVFECSRLICEAGESGALECLVPDDPANPDVRKFMRVTGAEWTASENGQWHDDLYTSEVYRPWKDEPLHWANGKPLFFRKAESENWLRRLRSPHVLCNPPVADPASLPDRPYVTLSEAASWLAFGEAHDSMTLFSRMLKESGRASRYAEGGNETESEIDFGPWFATYLASLKRREHVRRILRDAMARGELVGRGRCQFQKGTSEVQEVSPDVFQMTFHLVLENDGIGIDPRAENPDSDAFLNGGNWKDIRFARLDLERLWGTPEPQKNSFVGPRGPAAPRKPRTAGRQNIGVVAARSYSELFPNGHEQLGHSWKTALDEIANRDGPRVSPRTLRRGLEARGQKKS